MLAEAKGYSYMAASLHAAREGDWTSVWNMARSEGLETCWVILDVEMLVHRLILDEDKSDDRVVRI